MGMTSLRISLSGFMMRMGFQGQSPFILSIIEPSSIILVVLDFRWKTFFWRAGLTSRLGGMADCFSLLTNRPHHSPLCPHLSNISLVFAATWYFSRLWPSHSISGCPYSYSLKHSSALGTGPTTPTSSPIFIRIFSAASSMFSIWFDSRWQVKTMFPLTHIWQPMVSQINSPSIALDSSAFY